MSADSEADSAYRIISPSKLAHIVLRTPHVRRPCTQSNSRGLRSWRTRRAPYLWWRRGGAEVATEHWFARTGRHSAAV